MKDLDFPFGYCTNVHAGTHLAEAKTNLLRYAGEVRKKIAPGRNLPVGLWLADQAARELAEPGAIEQFRDWLGENQFLPYTFNGFPQGDFHQEVVKKKVYEPSWLEDSRREHTILLADVLDKLLPGNTTGSISTLPLGWPSSRWPDKGWSEEQFLCAARNLKIVAKHLAGLADQTGREIVLAIEPEPGCVLDQAENMAQFFEHHLFVGPDERIARRFLTVCHDICHSAVMFEPQQQVLDDYLHRGLRIGKVQVSSAIEVPWNEYCGESGRECVGSSAVQLPHVPLGKRDVLERDVLERQLRDLREPRYLHQTTCASDSGTLAALAEDLPIALDAWLRPGSAPATNWRIHFHVPIFVGQFGQLRATRSDIGEACRILECGKSQTVEGRPWFTGHYEVETYAWPVLPKELLVDNLACGIAQELEYLEHILATAQPHDTPYPHAES